MTEKSATVTLGEKQVELPVREGTIGPSVVDIATLYKHTGGSEEGLRHPRHAPHHGA